MKHKLLCVLLLASSLPAASALGQADTVAPPRPLFTSGDAVLAGVFVFGTLVTRPIDKHLAQRLQRPETQERQFLQKSARVFNATAVPGAFIIGGTMYIVGRASESRRLADLGLHGTEALLIGEVLGGAMKGVFGRGRPYLTPQDPNPDDWGFMRGFGNNDGYRSFPSGHSVAAFAAAAAVTAEMSKWSPGTRWMVGTAMYGGAGMVGLSRMYNNRHWASDVMVGAAIGIFAGNKVVRYHHSHPGNRLDEWLVNFSLNPQVGLRSLRASVLPRSSPGAPPLSR